MHRHEPPVVGGEIKIVWRGCGNGKQEEHEIKEEDKGHEWMVIEKPGSMPVSPPLVPTEAVGEGRVDEHQISRCIRQDATITTPCSRS
jgi:hypothetical protein